MRQLIPRSLAPIAVSMSLFVVSSALSGCTYVDAMLQRRAPPDTRVKLGWQDRVFVYSRDAANYTCQSHYILTCDRGGAITLSCTCMLR
jgi:hypothetical protein